MNQRELIAAIKAANVSKDDWVHDILSQVQDKFARGYLSCRVGALDNSLSQASEDFRDELLATCRYDIWNK